MTTLYLRPDAVGDEVNLIPYPSAPNWDCVNEETPNEDVDYVLCPPANDLRDLHYLQDTAQTGTINWIKVWVRAKKIGAPGAGYTAIKTGGVAYDGSLNTLTDAYANYSTQYATNPQAGGAWTWAQLNALQAGVRLAAGSEKGDGAYCTQVYVEVDYTVVVAPLLKLKMIPKRPWNRMSRLYKSLSLRGG